MHATGNNIKANKINILTGLNPKWYSDMLAQLVILPAFFFQVQLAMWFCGISNHIFLSFEQAISSSENKLLLEILW